MARPKNQRPLPRNRLFQKMSEVIWLREKVAQAELAARFLNLPIDEREEMAEPPQKVTRQKEHRQTAERPPSRQSSCLAVAPAKKLLK
jgi:hypothetical protein